MYGTRSTRTLSRFTTYSECFWNRCFGIGWWQMETISGFVSETSFVQTYWPSCSLEATDPMNFFKTIYSELRESHSTIVFAALEVLISTLLLHSEVWALVEVIDLIIDDSPKKLVAITAKLSPVEFAQEPTASIAEYICYAHNTNMLSAADSMFHGYIRPSSTDPQDSSWIPALTFSDVVSQWLDPFWPKQQWQLFWRNRLRNTQTIQLIDQHAFWAFLSRQTHVANIAGGVIGEHACTHYFDSIHGRDKRWGLRSHLSPLTHVACLMPSG